MRKEFDKSTDRGFPAEKAGGFDRIFLSVGTEDQKTLLEFLCVDLLRQYGETVQILSDSPDGARIGSGGALLRALLEQGVDVERQKILLINCGGMSQRISNYSYCTKAMIPVSRDSGRRTNICLAHILRSAIRLSKMMAPGLFVCCSDILIDVSEFTGDLTENTAFCVEAPVEVGTRHGVMFSDPEGQLTEYFQKASEQTLRIRCSDNSGAALVAVDAGWTFFSANAVSVLKDAAAEFYARRGVALPVLNLYRDIMPLFASYLDRAAYLRSHDTEICRYLESRLRSFPMRVFLLRQPFRHFGTTTELLGNLQRELPAEKTYVFDSLLGPLVQVGEYTLLDHVRIDGASVVGRGCVLSDLDLTEVSVPDDTAVFGLRLHDGRMVAVAWKIERTVQLAKKTVESLWADARFFPDITYSASLRRYFTGNKSEEGISLSACIRNADAAAFAEWRRYVEDLVRFAGKGNQQYSDYREQILNGFFSEHPPLDALYCVRESAEVRLPVRINFSGTWTDCMPYCIECGGSVINAAVTVDGKKPIRVMAQRIPEKWVEFCNGEMPDRISVYDPNGKADEFSEFGLHRAVFQTLGIGKNTPVFDGVRLTVRVDGVMKGSGLGISSILLYGCFLSLCKLLGRECSAEDLLEMVFVAEQLMRTGGGWQDQGAVVGEGIKRVFALPGLPQQIRVETLPAAPGFLQNLNGRLVLISTGQRHFGRFIVRDVMDRYLRRERDNLNAFQTICELNGKMIESVQNGDLQLLTETVNAHSEALTRLSPLIYGEELLILRKKCLAYTDACCICGAGGGGYLWAIRKDNVTVPMLMHNLKTDIKTASVL